MSSQANAQSLPQVDIQKFQGPWYVIGYKPSALDKSWKNTIEAYTWNPEKEWYDTRTTYNKENGQEMKEITMKLIPQKDPSNAKWTARIAFFIRADYIIYRLGNDYSYVLVGHPKQKYMYIMSREPQLDEKIYLDLVDYAVKNLGYKMEDIVRHDQTDNIRKSPNTVK